MLPNRSAKRRKRAYLASTPLIMPQREPILLIHGGAGAITKGEATPEREAGIRAAGKGDGSIRIASYNGTPAIMKLIQDGDIMAAEQGENINWLAYANMDQAFRTLGGGPIIEDGFVQTPLRTFDDSNIDEAGTPPVGDKGYGDAYVKGYNELWGIEG